MAQFKLGFVIGKGLISAAISTKSYTTLHPALRFILTRSLNHTKRNAHDVQNEERRWFVSPQNVVAQVSKVSLTVELWCSRRDIRLRYGPNPAGGDSSSRQALDSSTRNPKGAAVTCRTTAIPVDRELPCAKIRECA